jgi:hypothetical protein
MSNSCDHVETCSSVAQYLGRPREGIHSRALYGDGCAAQGVARVHPVIHFRGPRCRRADGRGCKCRKRCAQVSPRGMGGARMDAVRSRISMTIIGARLCRQTKTSSGWVPSRGSPSSGRSRRARRIRPGAGWRSRRGGYSVRGTRAPLPVRRRDAWRKVAGIIRALDNAFAVKASA